MADTKTKPDKIRVRFDKNGFYHPAFGLLGRGADRGKVYWMPYEFAEKETIKVDVMDRRTRPPQKIGEREITRYKFLPSTAQILDDVVWEAEVNDAKQANEEPPKETFPVFSTESDVYLKKMGVKNPDAIRGRMKK